MAPDTDPTEEELAAVTDAVAVVLRQRAEQEARTHAERVAAAMRAVGVPTSRS